MKVGQKSRNDVSKYEKGSMKKIQEKTRKKYLKEKKMIDMYTICMVA